MGHLIPIWDEHRNPYGIACHIYNFCLQSIDLALSNCVVRQQSRVAPTQFKMLSSSLRHPVSPHRTMQGPMYSGLSHANCIRRMASQIALTRPLQVSANDRSPSSMHLSSPSPSFATFRSKNQECASNDIAEARKSDRRRSNYATAPADSFSPLAERAQQLSAIIADGGDNALCAAADLDREFPALG